jgi:glycosyltransferase involved in cell wall biosynthesis
MAGVPVLASDLPGVRIPVRETGFGVVVAPRDTHGIAEGLRSVRAAPSDRIMGSARARERYALSTILDAYEEVFRSVAVC